MSDLPLPSETIDRHIQERSVVEEKTPSGTCKHRGGRIIVVSADGTANEFGEMNTNVVELHSRILKDDEQLTFYISGIGTYGDSWVQRTTDMAFASTFKRNVFKAYKWIAENYRPGDRIFLFGFSRGAYQVRVIAGMIERVGLLHKGNNTQIPSVFKLYMSTMKRSGEKGNRKQDKALELCADFKRSFSHPDVKVHFVGVWDTVSSIGFLNGASLPETVNGMAHVCHFRQALALDEKRVRFWPEYANTFQPPSSEKTVSSSSGSDVKEVWFAGSHSDIGGSIPGEKKYGPALRWMTNEAMAHGLQMHSYAWKWQLPDPRQSLKAGWAILEVLPLRRPSNKRETTRKPHLGAPRQIQRGQHIHSSVLALMKARESNLHLEKGTSYATQARLPLDLELSWGDLVEGRGSEFIEPDPFSDFAALPLYNIQNATSLRHLPRLQSEIARLATNITAENIPKSLAEVPDALPILLSALDFMSTQVNIQGNNVAALFSVLALFPPDVEHKRTLPMFRGIAQKALNTPHVQFNRGVLRHATELLQTTYDLDNSSHISAVAIHSTGTIFSASNSKVMVQSDGSKRSINIGDQCRVSFRADGSRFATGDRHGIVKLWNIETGKELWTFEGHSSEIWSLAFSPDGCKIAAGSWDGTIRVWDTATGQDLFGAMEGHTDWVRGLAFSPDGTRLASGSFDNTVRLWDEAGKSKVLEGHKSVVTSVAFSKDYIISGSWDETIRVWNAVSCDLVRVLRGHTNWVYCVAFSPDFKLVASGSDDCTARLWDVSSGEVLAIYDVGDLVMCIAFSFDGKQIVTGSYKGKVQVWNADVLL